MTCKCELMPCFNVGDRVQLILNGFSAKPGATATVVDRPPHHSSSIYHPYVYIEWDRDPLCDHGQSDGPYFPSAFELVKPAVLTDQELADKAREIRRELVKVVQELEDRGYFCYIGSAKANFSPSEPVTFRKTVNVSI